MLKWLKGNTCDGADVDNVENSGIGLPVPSSPLAKTLNTAVEMEYLTSPVLTGEKCKRGQYSSFSTVFSR